MRTLHTTILLSLALVFAGCASPTEPTAEADESGPARRGPDAPVAADGAAPPRAPGSPPAVAAPVWREGDWWTWRIDSADSAEPFEVTTIVASADDSGYRLGVDALEPGLRAFVDHVLMVGAVSAADLSWEVHDTPARVLAFPLRDGATWTGVEEEREMTFTARAVRASAPDGPTDAFEALGATDDGPAVGFVYAPSVGHFLSYSIYYGNPEPYATATLVAHGAGRSGGTIIESDDAFAGFASGPRPPRPPMVDPRLTFEVPAHATHVLLACFAGGAGEQRVEAVGPGGTKLACARSGAEGPGDLLTDIQPAGAGTWAIALAATSGFIDVEVYALTLGS